MSQRSAVEVFTHLTSALVGEHDVADVLLALIRDGARLLSADAIGLVVRADDGGLELLSASSHRAAELEIFQDMQRQGPCVDCVRTGEPVVAAGPQALRSRWPRTGQTILAAGFQAVCARPLAWRGQVLGGLNTFWTQPAVPLDDQGQHLAQGLADMATLVLMQAAQVSAAQIAQRIQQALGGRVVIERAKGVLAYADGVDTATAYERLVQLAERNGHTVTAAADQVLRQAASPGE